MSIRPWLALVILPLSLQFAPSAQDPIEVPAYAQISTAESGQFIFYAVIEGLYKDGISNEVVDELMSKDEATGWPLYFIYACPVCMPAWNAFATYRNRPGFLGAKVPTDTFGPGLDEAATQRLLEGSREERMVAVRDLVRGWIDARLKRHRLTPEELTRYQIEFEEMRKIGMSYLKGYRTNELFAHIYSDVSFCPFCDAACEAPSKD